MIRTAPRWYAELGVLSEEFWRLIGERSVATGDQREALERTIWAKWGRTCAVLVSDMAHASSSPVIAGIRFICEGQPLEVQVLEKRGFVII